MFQILLRIKKSSELKIRSGQDYIIKPLSMKWEIYIALCLMDQSFQPNWQKYFQLWILYVKYASRHQQPSSMFWSCPTLIHFWSNIVDTIYYYGIWPQWCAITYIAVFGILPNGDGVRPPAHIQKVVAFTALLARHLILSYSNVLSMVE